MLKSEAEKVLRRTIEETKAEFSEEQISCLVTAMMKICGRIVEEALASAKSGPGGKATFFAD